MLSSCRTMRSRVWQFSEMAGYESFFFFQAESGIRDDLVTGVQTCALPISGRRRQDRAVETSTRPAPYRCRQKLSWHARAVAKGASPYPIHLATTAQLLCVAAKCILKCRVLLRAARTACRCCFAKSPAQRNAAPSEFGESGRWDALLSDYAFSFPGWQFSYLASLIQLTQFSASIGRSQD